MLDTNTINSSINSNKKLFEMFAMDKKAYNKAFIISSTKPDEIVYYNDETQKKKERNKKLYKILTLSFVAVASIGAISTAVVAHLKGKFDPKDYLTKISQNKKIKDTTEKGMVIGNKALNGIINATNLKDDAWTMFGEKLNNKGISFVKKANDKLKDFYHFLSKKKYKESYNKAFENLKKAYKNANLEMPDIPDFDTWYDDMNKDILSSLSSGKRVTQELIDKDCFKISNLKQGISKTAKTFTRSLISEDKMAANNLREKYLSSIPEPEECSEEIKNATKAFNEIKAKNGNNIFERIRDTNLGNAGTDALGILASLGLLGGAVATAENKEERKSTVINLGIPLIFTLGGAIFSTLNCFSGLPAIIFSFATGQVAGIFAKQIDKASIKAQEKIKEETNA